MAKWAMRALLVLSAASMALAVAPSVGASPNTSNQSPQTSNSSNDSRYDNKGKQDKCNNGNSNSNSRSNSNSGNDCKITICHGTSSATNPYVKITVSVNSVAYQGHLGHVGGGPFYPDIIPAPDDGCPKPGYNPDDIEAKARKVTRDGVDKVRFSFEGCHPGKRLGVKIDGKTVAGSPFRVPRGGVVSKTVRIPAGADGDVIKFTCPRPEIVWEMPIQSGMTPHSFGSPLAVQSLSVSNPAQAASLGSLSGSITAPGSTGSSGTTVPAQQLGFGLASACGLIAFGGLRNRTRRL